MTKKLKEQENVRNRPYPACPYCKEEVWLICIGLESVPLYLRRRCGAPEDRKKNREDFSRVSNIGCDGIDDAVWECKNCKKYYDEEMKLYWEAND